MEFRIQGRVSTGAQRTGAMPGMAEISAQHDTFALSDNPPAQESEKNSRGGFQTRPHRSQKKNSDKVTE